MNLINYYGFSVDATTQRVYLKEGKFAGWNQQIPTSIENITVGTSRGTIQYSNPKIGMNAENNLVYFDIKGKPYAGKIVMREYLPHTEDGKLLVDTVGKITSTYKALGFTEFGGVAMNPVDVAPDAPKLNNVYPANTSVVLDYDEVGDEPEYYTGYAQNGTDVFTSKVYDPDEDMAIQGLTTGKTYDCWVTATNQAGRESPKSNVMKATCKSIIPAPVFTSCVANDGYATVTYQDIKVPDGFTIDHYAYSAINMDAPKDPAMEGHIENGKIVLTNDINWYVRICAVCNPGRVPGDFSDALTVTPCKQSVPYTPKITNCYVKDAGQIFVSWVKGTNGNKDSSANTVDKWQVNVTSVDGKGKDFTVEVPDPQTLTITTDKVSIGQWMVTVQGHNDMGWSKKSDAAAINYNPVKQDPLLGGLRYSTDKYEYAVFYADTTTGYEACRTSTGTEIDFDVLMVGAGGGGKNQTVTLGKGGDGGGGEMVLGKLPATHNTSSIFITVPNGGTRSSDNPVPVTVKEANTTLTAQSGKTATDKNDAAGYPKTKAPDGWNDILPFTWLMPGSQYVGGVAQLGEQNYPNATFRGQGGVGTKDSNAGKGGGSMVIIRWTK